MLIEIPDDLARKAKRSMTRCRNAAQCRSDAALAELQGRPIAAVLDLMYAAILEADLPEPVQVGHLARSEADDDTFLVLHLGRERALLEAEDGWETSRLIADLTYAGPKPEGWGEQ